MRHSSTVLLVMLLLNGRSQAARFRGNLVNFEVITGSGGRPSLHHVFADADTFAARPGLMRQREKEAARLRALVQQPLSFAERIYTLRFDPAKRPVWDDITLIIYCDRPSRRVEFFLTGVRGTQSREFMQRIKADFHREFSRRYGARSIVDNKEFYEGGSLPAHLLVQPRQERSEESTRLLSKRTWVQNTTNHSAIILQSAQQSCRTESTKYEQTPH